MPHSRGDRPGRPDMDVQPTGCQPQQGQGALDDRRPGGLALAVSCHAVMLLCGVRACGHSAQRFVSRPIIYTLQYTPESQVGRRTHGRRTGRQGPHHDDRTQDTGPNADGDEPCSSGSAQHAQHWLLARPARTSRTVSNVWRGVEWAACSSGPRHWRICGTRRRKVEARGQERSRSAWPCSGSTTRQLPPRPMPGDAEPCLTQRHERECVMSRT